MARSEESFPAVFSPVLIIGSVGGKIAQKKQHTPGGRIEQDLSRVSVTINPEAENFP